MNSLGAVLVKQCLLQLKPLFWTLLCQTKTVLLAALLACTVVTRETLCLDTCLHLEKTPLWRYCHCLRSVCIIYEVDNVTRGLMPSVHKRTDTVLFSVTASLCTRKHISIGRVWAGGWGGRAQGEEGEHHLWSIFSYDNIDSSFSVGFSGPF